MKITSLANPCTIGKNFSKSNILVDNRDKISICNNVTIASGVKILRAGHNVTSNNFDSYTAPMTLSDYSVFMSDVSILPGIDIGKGGVFLRSSVVTYCTKALSIVEGVADRYIKMRTPSPI